MVQNETYNEWDSNTRQGYSNPENDWIVQQHCQYEYYPDNAFH